MGTFGATHGIKGNIKIHTSGDALASHAFPIPCDTILTDGTAKKVEILSLTPSGSFFIAKVKGFDTPEAVVLLRNAVIFLPRESLPEIDSEEIYVMDLIGLAATIKLGESPLNYTITEVIDNPAHPILRFSSNDDISEPKEILVPFLHLYIGDWDLNLKQIEVRSWELWFEV